MQFFSAAGALQLTGRPTRYCFWRLAAVLGAQFLVRKRKLAGGYGLPDWASKREYV